MNTDFTSETLFTIQSLNDLTPSTMADLLHFLVEKEQAPGGPYSLSPHIKQNVRLNFHIYRLFSRAGKRLVPTQDYVLSLRSLLTHKEKTHLQQLVSQESNQQAHHPNNNTYVPIQKTLAATLIPELQQLADPILQKIIQIDAHGEISLLSKLFFESSAGTKPQKTPSKDTLALLGQANTYTWLAYSLYDCQIDEQTSPLTIATANIIQRFAYHSYLNAGVTLKQLEKAFTDTDCANALEIAYCRVPVTTTTITIQHIPTKKLLTSLLSQRSVVHCLGPLWLIPANTRSGPSRAVKRVFNLYCAARQLNDDIHDWEDDIRNGRITYVTAALLQAAQIEPGTHRLHILVKKFRQLLWEGELYRLLSDGLAMAEDAQKGYIEKLNLKPSSPFEEATIQPILQSYQAALKQLEYDKEFVKHAHF